MIESLLKEIKEIIESINPVDAKYLVSKGNNNGFEDLVIDVIKNLKTTSSIYFDYVAHLGHHFPDLDIIINGQKFGIEIKSRNNGGWDTNGNSVFESITDEDYTEIYVLFGSTVKGSPAFKVKYDYYWKVTSNIVVTHSPRFKINMDTSSSVFESAEKYNVLRQYNEKEKILFLQDFLKRGSDSPKWYIPTNSENIKPISLNSLNKKTIRRLKAEVLILYPQDYIIRQSNGKIKSKYERSAVHLLTNYYYYSSSFRDLFSAGGRYTYKGIELPKLFETIKDLKVEINSLLKEFDESYQNLAYESWKELNISLTKKDFINDYFAVIDYLGRKWFSSELEKLEENKLSTLLLISK